MAKRAYTFFGSNALGFFRLHLTSANGVDQKIPALGPFGKDEVDKCIPRGFRNAHLHNSNAATNSERSRRNDRVGSLLSRAGIHGAI